MDAATITSWMREIEASVRAERDHLVQLDAAIGDADHGINMARGFEAVVQALSADNGSPPGRLLIVAGRTLVSTVGGASGFEFAPAIRTERLCQDCGRRYRRPQSWSSRIPSHLSTSH